mgnify:FL=1
MASQYATIEDDGQPEDTSKSILGILRVDHIRNTTADLYVKAQQQQDVVQPPLSPTNQGAGKGPEAGADPQPALRDPVVEKFLKT